MARIRGLGMDKPQVTPLRYAPVDWINRKAPMAWAVNFGCLEAEVDRAGAKEPYEDCRL
jgi:hypothetical protein